MTLNETKYDTLEKGKSILPTNIKSVKFSLRISKLKELITRFKNWIKMKHGIKRIVIHCSATRVNQDYSFEQLEKDHRLRGFSECGYNYYIRKDGKVYEGRNIGDELAHAAGYNRNAIAICYEGGLNEQGKSSDTRTIDQKRVLLTMIMFFNSLFPDAEILGHRDLPNVAKDCPCFNVKTEYLNLLT